MIVMECKKHFFKGNYLVIDSAIPFGPKCLKFQHSEKRHFIPLITIIFSISEENKHAFFGIGQWRTNTYNESSSLSFIYFLKDSQKCFIYNK